MTLKSVSHRHRGEQVETTFGGDGNPLANTSFKAMVRTADQRIEHDGEYEPRAIVAVNGSNTQSGSEGYSNQITLKEDRFVIDRAQSPTTGNFQEYPTTWCRIALAQQNKRWKQQ